MEIVKPGSISPENESWVAAVGGNRTILVATLEIRDLYVAAAGGYGVRALHLYNIRILEYYNIRILKYYNNEDDLKNEDNLKN